MFFINLSNQKINDKFFTGQSWLSISYRYWHSINLSYSKTYARGVFRPQLNIYNKAFSWFSHRWPIVDVLLGSKYASAYIYTRASPIEIILHIILSILIVFAVRYRFLIMQEWNKLAISELKLLSLYFKLASYSLLWFIPVSH